MGECLEHEVIRNHLADITRLISSDPSAGPTWFAQKLEEKAFIANAANAVVPSDSRPEQTIKLLDAVKGRIDASQEPGREFAKFLEILQSNPPLMDLAKKLLKEYGKFGYLRYTLYVYTINRPKGIWWGGVGRQRASGMRLGGGREGNLGSRGLYGLQRTWERGWGLITSCVLLFTLPHIYHSV